MEGELNKPVIQFNNCSAEEYLFTVNCIADLKINQLRDWVVSRSGIKVADIKIKDLVFHNGLPIESGNGVYIFKEGDEIIYVGKCSSRVFSERIPAHFDFRKHAWMNSLLVNLIARNFKRREKGDKNDKNLQLFAHYAFDNLELVLINFPDYEKKAINDLERLLREVLQPINACKKKWIKDEEVAVREYIQIPISEAMSLHEEIDAVTN